MPSWPPGTRVVGVEVQIANAGPAIYDSSATGDGSPWCHRAAASRPSSRPASACKTPLEDFDRYITAGEDRVGCVVYAIPIRRHA